VWVAPVDTISQYFGFTTLLYSKKSSTSEAKKTIEYGSTMSAVSSASIAGDGEEQNK